MAQMPLFVAYADVLLRMQFQELAGTTDVVNAAIISSQIHAESIIQGKLELSTVDCRYFLDSKAFSGMRPDGLYRIELPSGFVRSDYSFTVTYDYQWSMPNPQTADPTTYMLDATRGYLLMDECTYGCKYIRVQCSTGFKGSVPTPSFTGTANPYNNVVAYTPGQAVTLVVNSVTVTYLCIANTTGNTPPNVTYWTPVSYGPEPLPDDLYEAILSFVPSVFDASHTTVRDSDTVRQYEKSSDQTALLLKNYVRLNGFSFRPMISSIQRVTNY